MLALLAPTVAQTTPLGGQVVSGIGTIAQKGSITTITQSSQNLSLSWQSFNIAKTETVNFLQPSAAAIAVNRIYDTAGTTILGHLNANGQVWLINPNGILFGAGSQVNVGGLVASTLDNISTNGSAVSFSGNGTGSITNNGTIAGHYVAFIGPAVGNNGTISSNLGAVALGGGSAVTLTFAGLDLVKMQVDRSVLNSLAANGGLIQANGGMVILSAGAKDELLASVVNNTGIIEARTVNDQSGTITLLGGMSAGQVNVGGTLDASAPNGGNGGSIETSAHNVKIANDAKVTTLAASDLSGTWLIDPVDFTIAASGGNETGAQLSTALGSGNVTIQSSNGTSGTAGDINVNDTVSWSANTTLTLNAVNNININSSITATGASGAVALYYGQGAVNSGNTATYSFGLTGSGFTGQINLQAGNNFSTKLGSDGSVVSYTVIDSLGTQSSSNDGTLQGMQGNLAGNYVLGANIDATGTSTWNSNTGFTPIGNSTTNFTGAFDGLGHTISSLTINQPAAYRIGMFGVVSSGAAIRNVGLVGGSASGYQFVGELVGVNSGTISNVYTTGGVSGGGGAQSTTGGLVGQNSGTISNAYTTGNVSGGGAVGGFVGKNFGTISNAYTTGKVTGSGNYVGGLAGHNFGASSTISNSYATGNVSGGAYVGGLSGENYNGTISNSYATGSVSGGGNVGGLVGTSNHPISNSHATGSVSGTYNVGGLVGTNNGTLSNSYATGNVNGSSTFYTAVGGLVGWNYATVSNSYATGGVSGPQWIGGLIGYNYGAGSTVSNSYSTGGVIGSSYVGGLAGLNSGTISNAYATGSVSGSTYLGGLVGSSSGTVTNSFWDTATSGQATSAGGTGMATADMMTQANFTSATPANGNVNPNWDFTSTWVMYDEYTYPLLRFFMTPLTVTANNASKTYDGLAYSGGAGVTYSVTPNSNLLGSISYGGSSQGAVNAGSYAITPSGFYSNQQGYDISYAGGTLTVNQAPLTVTANNASKTYGQTAAFAGTAFTSSGLQNSETIGSVTETSTGSASTATVAGGPYAIVPSSATGGTFNPSNYSIVYVDGSLTVNPATLTVTANNASKTYGQTAAFAGTAFTSSGLQNSETIGSVTETSTGSASTATVAGGPYAIVPSLATGGTFNPSNYSIVYADGSLTVNPATLTYKADPASFFAGQAPSGLSGTIAGLAPGDTLPSTTTGTLSWTTTATSNSRPGRYAIDGGGLTLTSGNYAFLVQAVGNATALVLEPGIAPQRVQNVTAQLESSMLLFRTSDQPQTMTLPSTITVIQHSEAGSENGIIVNTTMLIGKTGSLQIINGGVKLP